MRANLLRRPPRALRKARLDNVTYREQYREIANGLPAGSVLTCMPPTENPQRPVLERVASSLKTKGYLVTTLLAERIG